MEQARYEILPSEGVYYGEIEGFDGVWATGDTLEACRRELQEVLEEWIVFRLSHRLPLPIIGEVAIAVPEAV